MGLIYRHIGPNGKSYIGKTTKTLNERLQQHINNNNDTLFSRAIKKYGIDSFISVVLEDNIDDNMLNEREIYWISYYDTYNKGYNMTKGGDGGDLTSNHPNKTKIYKKVSEKNSGVNNPFYGKTHSDELKSKWKGTKRGGASGWKQTDEVKQFISKHSIEKYKDGKVQEKISKSVSEYHKNNTTESLNRYKKRKENGNDKNHAKEYKIISPLGEEFIFKGKMSFKDFCVDRGISYNKMIKSIDKGKIYVNLNDNRVTVESRRCNQWEIKKV